MTHSLPVRKLAWIVISVVIWIVCLGFFLDWPMPAFYRLIVSFLISAGSVFVGWLLQSALPNIKSSGPGRIMLVASSVIMSLVWFAAVGFLVFVLTPTQWEARDWDSEGIMILCLFALVLIGIPFQLARYYQDWRRL